VNKRGGDKKKGGKEAAAEPSIPPELLLRRDHNVRYERGGIVYATDGKVGTLKQIVVDDTSGEVSDLVITVDDTSRIVLLSPDLVDKTAGSAVFVLVNRTQFAERAANLPDFERKHFSKVDAKALAKKASDRPQIPRRSVLSAGRDYVETPIANVLERLERRPTPPAPAPPPDTAPAPPAEPAA
jgi:sporulation protein YlmC with PRC-barrel domain